MPRQEETQQICLECVVFFKNLAKVQSQNLPKHQVQFFKNILEAQSRLYLTDLSCHILTWK